MAYRYPQYVTKSQGLLNAAHQFQYALSNDIEDQRLAADDLISSARVNADKSLILYYAAGTTPAIKGRPQTPEDALSAILLDAQSANLLTAAGFALKEAGASGDATLFDQAVSQIENTRASVKVELDAQRSFYAPATLVRSEDLNDAKQLFRSTADKILNEIVSETSKVSSSIIRQLRVLDPNKVAEAIGKLGETIPVATYAGRLVKLGIDKLKNAIDALIGLFGSKAFENIKSKIGEIWDKSTRGEYISTILEDILSVGAARDRIFNRLEGDDIKQEAIDSATNALAPLLDDYRRNVSLLSGIVSAIGLAVAILGYFQVVLPWLPLWTGVAYIAVIASSVLIGVEYCGSRRALGWVRGVVQIADGIQPR